MKNTNIINGVNRILFTRGILYLNGIAIAGEGIEPKKDIMFEFKLNKPEEEVEKLEVEARDPSILEVRVHDVVNSKDVGPGQF